MGMWACPGRRLQLASLQSQLCEGQVRHRERRVETSATFLQCHKFRRQVHGRVALQIGGQAAILFWKVQSQRGLLAESNLELQQPEYAQKKVTFHVLEKEKKSQSSSSTQ